jgi:hypothetical protein
MKINTKFITGFGIKIKQSAAGATGWTGKGKNFN